MSLTCITAFSTNRWELEDWTKRAKETFLKSGADIRGPIAGRPVSLDQFFANLDGGFDGNQEDVPFWIERLQLTEGQRKNLELQSKKSDSPPVVWGRVIESSHEITIRKVLEIQRDEAVQIHLMVREQRFAKTKSAPQGYDPKRDYVTDVDYDAHYS